MSSWWRSTAPTASIPPFHMAYTDITDRARTERLGAIRAELLERIRPVCQQMPHDLFLEMVENMAAIQLKYELRNVHGGR